MGRSRGGLTTKIHALVDALGLPLEEDHDDFIAEARASLPELPDACEKLCVRSPSAMRCASRVASTKIGRAHV